MLLDPVLALPFVFCQTGFRLICFQSARRVMSCRVLKLGNVIEEKI